MGPNTTHGVSLTETRLTFIHFHLQDSPATYLVNLLLALCGQRVSSWVAAIRNSVQEFGEVVAMIFYIF